MGRKNSKDDEFEIQFFEKLVENRPRFIEALSALGDLYTRIGLYEKGLAIDLKLAEYKPDDGIVFYNLACSYSLLNHIDLSLETLKKAIEYGYEDFDHLRQDEDLNNLRKDSRFETLMMNIK